MRFRFTILALIAFALATGSVQAKPGKRSPRPQRKSPSPSAAPKPIEIAIKSSKGHLSDSAISKVIASRMDDLQRCYAQIRILNPEANGRLEYQVQISQYGSADKIRVKPHTLPSNLEVCVTDHMKTWKFGGSKDGADTKATYSIYFRSPAGE